MKCHEDDKYDIIKYLLVWMTLVWKYKYISAMMLRNKILSKYLIWQIGCNAGDRSGAKDLSSTLIGQPPTSTHHQTKYIHLK